MSKIKKKTGIILAVLVLLLVVCGIYLSDYYRADIKAIDQFSKEHAVEQRVLSDGILVFEPDEATDGLIFYPGGKVEYTAYILVEMPFHLAVFDIGAADGIQENYPQIENWYIGGHSLGGSMAAAYLKKNKEAYEGLILLGSYSTADFSESDLSVLSIYGSEDGVMNHEKYEKNKKNLPGDFTEFVIDGGCHAGFGMYGTQDGDGTPTISGVEQIDTTAEVIEKFVSR